MRTATIEFKCPECGHSRIVMKREKIQSREVLDGFTVVDGSTPGVKYNLLTSSQFHNEGTLVNFQCECCDFTIKQQSTNAPIRNINHLYSWLKRFGMLKE